MSLSNNRGFITLDFIFAITVSMGFTVAFFAMATTFAAVEIGQYITFATARVYAGAHANEKAQNDLAQKKFDELMKNKALQSLFRNGWFSLKKPEIGDHNKLYPQSASEESATFWGVRAAFEAEVININIPFIGKTKTLPTTGAATLATYLMREPTDDECREVFNKERHIFLRGLDGAYNAAPFFKPVTVTDNGC